MSRRCLRQAVRRHLLRRPLRHRPSHLLQASRRGFATLGVGSPGNANWAAVQRHGAPPPIATPPAVTTKVEASAGAHAPTHPRNSALLPSGVGMSVSAAAVVVSRNDVSRMPMDPVIIPGPEAVR